MNDSERSEVLRRVRDLVENDPAMIERIRKSFAAAKPVIDDLAMLGYQIETLAELRHQGKPWKTALPVLLAWLPTVDDLDVKQEIVSCLSVPWIENKATALLIEEFRRHAEAYPLVGWTIGNALSIVDVEGFEDQIIELSRNSKYGMARQMLVLGLGRLQIESAEEAGLDLLEDEEVRLHAVIALGKMKSKRALPALEKLLTDKRAVIRKEARKAITKIMRAGGPR